MQSFTDLTGLDEPTEPDGAGGEEGPIGGRRPAGDSLPVIAGAATAIAGVGGALALADIGSPLRAPFTLFFLLVAPACALSAVLRGLDPLSRSVVATGGAVAVDLLIAETMLALHTWSVRGGVAAVAAVSLLLYLLAHARRHRGRAARSRAS
ncbi:hypothetical protein BLA24_29295 [Streptomyces cinnamoneus]|uniref:Uncharacterized protein n=2 Tax=Streptomyces cinnamoneus TaxID=53446 RepID=A0A2G1XBK5_STRCJ|nr:hypothetical protein [Streptomyces cinnamoneus]PHQ48590.1 hypothetical protein BLA24_29295 [Streptomyces cinnamoneus]PPT12540.1 hypothetical protein CYQ11_06180 [Streptomyces cinnamoneus]